MASPHLVLNQLLTQVVHLDILLSQLLAIMVNGEVEKVTNRHHLHLELHFSELLSSGTLEDRQFVKVNVAHLPLPDAERLAGIAHPLGSREFLGLLNDTYRGVRQGCVHAII